MFKMNCNKVFTKDLIERFASTYEFCKRDINNLRKCVYYCLIKKIFIVIFNMEEITDANYEHAKNVFKTFNNKNIGDYYDLYAHSETLLLSDVFEDFRNKCIKIYDDYHDLYVQSESVLLPGVFED